MKKTISIFWALLILLQTALLNAQFPSLPLISAPSRDRPLDKSMEVGTIQGSFEVSSLGSANYSIPLEIVPGTKGIQPQLLISYTNQTGRALLGHGWNLDGLSSISRSSQTTYYEGQKKEITLTNNDPLSLDGQRLLLMSGTAMTTGAIYRFEIEDYTRVYITNANSVSGPLTLEVRKNDGSIFYYGENNSCIKTNTGIAYQWRIHKSKDIYGNYIQYNYGNTNLANLSGESYIDNIQYTGNASAGIAPRNSIKFNYAISPTTKQYILGHEITNDLIITSIEVQQQNTTIRTYSFKYFKYSNSQFSLHLAEIHQSMQGKSLNPTIIQWGPEINNYDIKDYPSTPLSYRQTVIGDFNGDGRSDYIKYNSFKHHLYLSSPTGLTLAFTSNDWGAKQLMAFDIDKDGKDELIRLDGYTTNTSLYTYGLKEDNSYFELDNAMPYPPTNPPAVLSKYGPSEFNMFPGDIDGDGELDITLSFHNICCADFFIKPNVPNSSLNNIFGLFNPILTTANFYHPSSTMSTDFIGTDFNGNGVTEIFATNNINNTNNYGAYEYDIAANKVNTLFYNNFNLPIHTAHERRKYPADFNGDGKTDLLTYNQKDNYWKLHLSKGNNFNIRIIPSNGWPIINTELPRAGEYNKVFTQEYINGNPDLTEFESACEGSNNIVLGDFNGDGMSDLAYLKIEEDDPNDEYAFYVEVYYSLGIGFQNSGMKIFLGKFKDNCDKIPVLQVGDFNGDSRSDIIVHYYTDGTNRIIYFNANSTPQLVNFITNGYKNKIEIVYKTIANNLNYSPIYEKSVRSFGVPLIKLQAPMYVVDRTANPDGVGGRAITSYYYKDLIQHNKGKGILGFGEIRTQAPNGLITQTINTWDAANQYFLSKTETNTFKIFNIAEPLTHDQLSHNETNYSTISLAPKIKMLLKSYESQTDYMEQILIKNWYTYFPNNYLQSTKTETFDKITNKLENVKTIEVLNYTNVGTLLGLRPYEISELNELKDDINSSGVQNPFKRTKRILYNPTGEIQSVIFDEGDAKYEMNHEYSYFNTGTLEEKKQIANGKTRTEKYLYDQYHVNLTQTNDIEISPIKGIQSTYYASNGLIESELDMFTNKSQYYTFDLMNRKNKIVDYFGVTTSINYSWSDKPNTLYSITTSGISQPTIIEYYDLLGRLVASEIESFNGLKNAFNTYNQYGQLIASSKPVYKSDPPQNVQYAYDDYGRLISVQDACGRVVLNNYLGNRITQTVDASGRMTYIKKNALNLIIESEDIAQQKVYFKYTSNLEKRSITTNSSTITYEYDLHKNKTREEESNSNIKNYEYNAFDLLVKEFDSKYNYTFYTYDDAQRLKKKEIYHNAKFIGAATNIKSGNSRNEVIDYLYESDIFNTSYSLIKNINSSLGTQKSYQYNNNRQIEVLVEKINGKFFTTKYQYNGVGKLETTTFPNNYQITNEYNHIGLFYKVIETLSKKELFTLKEEDGKGRERLSHWGNPDATSTPNPDFPLSNNCGLIISKNYSSCDDRLTISTDALFQGSNQTTQAKQIYKLNYEIDLNRGNITSREDVIKGFKENFEYDDADRLVNIIAANQNNSMSIDYQDNGNIETKSDIGNYRYSSSNKPHAVRKIVTECDQASLCLGKQFVQYNGFDRPFSIMQDDLQMNIDYDHEENRNYWALYQYPSNIDHINEKNIGLTPNPTIAGQTWGSGTSLSGNGTLLRQKYYSGLYEEKFIPSTGNTIQYAYILGPTGVIGVNITESIKATSSTYYIQKDNIGSYMALIDACGNIAQEYSYNAWGKRRNPYGWYHPSLTSKPSNVDPVTGNWNEPDPSEPPFFDPSELSSDCTPDYQWLIDRGYIGQEHHDMFGLINLNARLYDPAIGRMLSPDTKVSNILNSQDHNRYSYAHNNPLKYIDPDGKNPILVAGLIAVGIYASTYTLQQGFNSNWTFRNWNWGDFGLGIFTSFAQGIMTTGIGQAFNALQVTSFIKEVGRAAAFGGLNAMIGGGSGGDFLSSFITSFVASGASSLAGARIDHIENQFIKDATKVGVAALSGGIMEQIQGGDFSKGAANGLIIGLLNHVSGSYLIDANKTLNKSLNDGGDYLVYEAKYISESKTEGNLIWYNSLGEEIIRFPALSGSTNAKYFSIPAGEWEASSINLTSNPKFERFGVSFRITLGPDRFDAARGFVTSLLRIHPLSGLGTEGCIGLTGFRKNLLNFINMYTKFNTKFGSMNLNVNYHK